MVIPGVPTAALPSVLRFRGTFFAPGMGGVGGDPTFEMPSDLLEINKPVCVATGNLILDFLFTSSSIR